MNAEDQLKAAEVLFDRAKLARFKLAYNQVSSNKGKCFTFDGERYIVGYAKYLIEYLEGRLPSG